MTPTEARLATLRDDLLTKIAACAEAQKQHLFGIANVSAFDYANRLLAYMDATRSYTAEIAAIEAEARGGAYVPKVGDVVRAFENEYVITGFYDPDLGMRWPIRVSAVLGQKVVGTGAASIDQITYLRPATPAERIAAGIDKAPTEPRFRVGQRVRVTKTGANCAAVHEGDVVTVDDSDATGITTTTGWMIHNEYLEALPSESPAPPPARPKRIRLTHLVSDLDRENVGCVGDVCDVIRWDGAMPVIRWRNGEESSILATKWVPADEPEGDEARYAEVVRVAQNLVDSYGRLRSWDETTCADVHELRKALARAKVKS